MKIFVCHVPCTRFHFACSRRRISRRPADTLICKRVNRGPVRLVHAVNCELAALSSVLRTACLMIILMDHAFSAGSDVSRKLITRHESNSSVVDRSSRRRRRGPHRRMKDKKKKISSSRTIFSITLDLAIRK